jgi:hypothetical protein
LTNDAEPATSTAITRTVAVMKAPAPRMLMFGV